MFLKEVAFPKRGRWRGEKSQLQGCEGDLCRKWYIWALTMLSLFLLSDFSPLTMLSLFPTVTQHRDTTWRQLKISHRHPFPPPRSYHYPYPRSYPYPSSISHPQTSPLFIFLIFVPILISYSTIGTRREASTEKPSNRQTRAADHLIRFQKLYCLGWRKRW